MAMSSDARGYIDRGCHAAENGHREAARVLFAQAYLIAGTNERLRTSALNLIAMWDFGAAKTTTISLDREVYSASFAPDDRHIVTASCRCTWGDYHDAAAEIWDCITASRTGGPFCSPHDGMHDAVFSQGGDRVITSQGGDQVYTTYEMRISRLWDASTGQSLDDAVRPNDDPFWPRIYSHDGRLALNVDFWNHIARLWDVDASKSIGNVMSHEGDIEVAAFSNDGQLVVTGSYDRRACIWEVPTGSRLGKPLLHSDAVDFVLISPDNRKVLTQCVPGGLKSETYLWDLPTGDPVCEVLQNSGGSPAFSPDGQMVITVGPDFIARFRDTANGEILGDPLIGDSGIVHVAFSPDGRMLLTSGRDDTARFWDVVTRKPVGPSFPCDGRVCSIAFSPTGRMIAVCEGRRITLWMLPKIPDNPDFVRSWAGASGLGIGDDGRIRNLTNEEAREARHALGSAVESLLGYAGNFDPYAAWDY